MTLDDLIAFGANTEEGLRRCMNNEAFYLRLVKMAAEDAGFGKLTDALAGNDLDAAFEVAHGLKGVLGNLSLTPMYNLACEMTELLRAGTVMDYKPMLDQLLEIREI